MGDDVERMPMSTVDTFVFADDEAKRIADTIMVVFDLEFAWQVISMDTSVVKLAKRVRLFWPNAVLGGRLNLLFFSHRSNKPTVSLALLQTVPLHPPSLNHPL
jgi:lipid-A-disaccharide synthase-like uncharacterized protein